LVFSKGKFRALLWLLLFLGPLSAFARDSFIEVVGGIRYQCTERLGEGGFGEVFRARKMGPNGEPEGPEVALKIYTKLPLPSGIKTMSEQFKGAFPPNLLSFEGPFEARRENPVTHETGDPRSAIIMPLMGPAVDPYRWGDRGGLGFTGDMARVIRTIRFSEQAIAALAEMRSRNLYHRDIKPPNFLLTGSLEQFDNGTAAVVLSDFDLVNWPLNTGIVVGTPGYLSPEILESKEGMSGSSADLFALGNTLYELLFRRSAIIDYLGEGSRPTDVVNSTHSLLDSPQKRAGFEAHVKKRFDKLRRRLPAEQARIDYLETLTLTLLNAGDPDARLAAYTIRSPSFPPVADCPQALSRIGQWFRRVVPVH
jgi:serine/threonine protein kinase